VGVNSRGQAADYDSNTEPFGLSAHGRYVVMVSDASNLVPRDTNHHPDVFVRDRLRGNTERVSVGPQGRQADGEDIFAAAISADGRFVAYDSNSTNLVRGDSNRVHDVFVRDRLRGTTVRASVSSTGKQGNGYSDSPALAANGRYVAYTSVASNLVKGDTNHRSDVFVHDLRTGVTRRVSVGRGHEGNGGSSGASLSADGRYIAFASEATNLVARDTNGVSDAFVRDQKRHRTERISLDSKGHQRQRPSFAGDPTGMSADGRFVVFRSEASKPASDGSRKLDLFVRDGRTRRAQLVSQPEGGEAPSISADGRYVAYTTTTVIFQGESEYGHDLVIDRRCRTAQRMRNPGGYNSPPFISADGAHVAFGQQLDYAGPISAFVWDAASDRPEPC
jgi:Tol biopolymer transport system component